jgi:pimeloyl-ACP methyl ester carboxylesterase
MDMPDFSADGVRLHYALAGPEDGPPIVLVHGFASDYELNWVGSRWQEALTAAGRLVIGLDCRGHGRSDKPHDPAAYARPIMARDVVGLLDHLDLDAADYLGYSMGARIGLDLAIDHGDRVRRMVLGGLGVWEPRGRTERIARRLRGDESVRDPDALAFYEFASARPTNDLVALASCIMAPQPPIGPDRLATIKVPVLIVAGDQDELARQAPEMAAAIPGARYVSLDGRNHMNAVPARQFKEAALAFLAGD